MSIKGFLEAKEMQTGGMLQQSFTGPFANQSRRDPSGAGYIPSTYAPPKPPTIALPPITPLPPAAPTAEEIAQLDPGNVGSHADYNYNVTDAIAGAAKAGMGPLTPAQIGMLEPSLAASLAATMQPETAMSRTLDATIGQAIPFTPEGRLGLSLGALTPGAVGLATQRGLTGETLTDQVSRASAAVTSLFSDSKPTTTTPLSAAVQNSAQQFAAVSKSTAPVGYTYPGGGFGATVTPASTTLEPTIPASARQAIAAINQTPAAPTAAQTGAEMFDAFGMGGEVSPNFAIGGSGSYTSFGHYGAGISQADEISIAQSGIENNSSGFETPEASKDTIDAMVSNGYAETTITAVATGQTTTQDIEGLAAATGAGDPGAGGGADSVICQELYDQGLLEHSIYSLDEQFGEHIRKHDSDLLEGYHTWAYDVVNAMRKSKTITHIVRIVSRPVVKHIAYKMGYPSKTLLGAVMFNVGAFVCRRLAKKETVYA